MLKAHNLVDAEDLWNIGPADYAALFPHAEEGPVRVGKQGQAKEDCQEWAEYIAASFLWSFWHSSPVSGEQMFSFDETAGSMHQREALTVEDAVCAVTRLYDTVEGVAFTAVTDPAAVSVNRNILTPELMEQAKAAPAVTAEDHPVWTGFVLGQEFSASLINETDRIRQTADWGFNSVRLEVDYRALFNGDVTAVNLAALEILDQSIAAVIQNHMHLNLCLTTLPGRTATIHSDLSSEADLDLFINPEKQELANWVWAVLAQRYQEIPSACLSFTPFWELFNKSLSTGLPEPEYTMSDAGRYMADVIDVIRGQDHDRLIIAEVGGYPSNDIAESSANAFVVLAELGERENLIVSFSFVEGRYVYAHMTTTPREHIDFSTRSNFLTEYPTYYYSLSPYIIDMDRLLYCRVCT